MDDGNLRYSKPANHPIPWPNLAHVFDTNSTAQRITHFQGTQPLPRRGGSSVVPGYAFGSSKDRDMITKRNTACGDTNGDLMISAKSVFPFKNVHKRCSTTEGVSKIPTGLGKNRNTLICFFCDKDSATKIAKKNHWLLNRETCGECHIPTYPRHHLETEQPPSGRHPRQVLGCQSSNQAIWFRAEPSPCQCLGRSTIRMIWQLIIIQLVSWSRAWCVPMRHLTLNHKCMCPFLKRGGPPQITGLRIQNDHL